MIIEFSMVINFSSMTSHIFVGFLQNPTSSSLWLLTVLSYDYITYNITYISVCLDFWQCLCGIAKCWRGFSDFRPPKEKISIELDSRFQGFYLTPNSLREPCLQSQNKIRAFWDKICTVFGQFLIKKSSPKRLNFTKFQNALSPSSVNRF